jgi:hypothetical protein
MNDLSSSYSNVLSSNSVGTPSHSSRRSFHLPLQTELDQSSRVIGGSHVHAKVSVSPKSARKASSTSRKQSRHHETKSLGAEAASVEFAAQLVAASAARPMSVGNDVSPPTISALLVAATTPSQSPQSVRKGNHRSHHSLSSLTSHMSNQSHDIEVQAVAGMAPEEHDMLFELSSAMHAEERASRGFQFGVDDSMAAGGSSNTAGIHGTVSNQQSRRMPTLPAAQLKSLVRSHVRHVGLSARLKNKTHVRTLREAQMEARQRAQLQAVKAVYLAPVISPTSVNDNTTARGTTSRNTGMSTGSHTAPVSSKRPRNPIRRGSESQQQSDNRGTLERLRLDETIHAHLLPASKIVSSIQGVKTRSHQSSPSPQQSQHHSQQSQPSIVPWPSWLSNSVNISGDPPTIHHDQHAQESHRGEDYEDAENHPMHNLHAEIHSMRNNSTEIQVPSSSSNNMHLPPLNLSNQGLPSINPLGNELAHSTRMPIIPPRHTASLHHRPSSLQGSFSPTH